MTSTYVRVLILQALLQQFEGAGSLKVEDDDGAPSKDAEGALPRSSVRVVDHRKGLNLKGVPWSTTIHGTVRDVDDRVNGLVSNDCSALVGDGVKEDLLDGGEGRGRELIVERQGLPFGRVSTA
jgi:hypothetical protein